ncbi:NlpC/P60 family protein [Bacteroidota bacterium]
MEDHFALCLQGITAIRKEADERSEMVSQILFGEYAEILEMNDRWLHISLLYDNYKGWVDRKCVVLTDAISETPIVVSKLQTRILNKTLNIPLQIPAGAMIPAYEHNEFHLAGYTFTIEVPDAFTPTENNSLEELIDSVSGISYLWGGRCGAGFDCSGLTQYLYKASGRKLPRDASEQAMEGSFVSEAALGDLAFFDNDEGVITHVGMMLGNNRILHASGTVRTDSIDQQGIFNTSIHEYTHTLRIIKRI